MAGDGTIYAAQLDLDIVWKAEEEEEAGASFFVSAMGLWTASVALAAIIY